MVADTCYSIWELIFACQCQTELPVAELLVDSVAVSVY